MPYASDLDLVGKNQRQRKVRRIWQDSREHDVITANQLTGLGYTVETLGMPIGDYGWEIRPEAYLSSKHLSVVVERKSLADLRDVRRLNKQLGRMRETFTQTPLFIVLIEHSFDTDKRRRWSDEAVANAKLSIQLGGVLVTECEGNDVAGRLHSLYTWSQKKTHQLAGGD
jgi:ERCC4-type nuclease